MVLEEDFLREDAGAAGVVVDVRGGGECGEEGEEVGG